MPLVRITLYEGSTSEAKKKMVESVTEAIVTTLNKKPETVSIYIEDISMDNVAKGGVLASEAARK